MTFFFLVPSMLLAGLMFPFRCLPEWAQMVGSRLPLTHFLVLVRCLLLKGYGLLLFWPRSGFCCCSRRQCWRRG